VPSGRESDHPFAFWDYLATFAELTGQPLPVESDGVSILPLLLGDEGQAEHDYLYFEFHEQGGRQAVIQGDWKLLHLDVRSDAYYELYNLASDPSENHNLVNLYPGKAEELKELMRGARSDHPDWPLFKQ
jgi:arylsulfatase A-like enzyme